MVACPECQKPVKNQAGLRLHVMYKHPDAAVPPEPEVVEERPAEQRPGRAFLEGLPRAGRLMTAGRTVKVLRPVCPMKGDLNCKRRNRARVGWEKLCPHNPYVAQVPVNVDVPVYEDMPDRPGTKRVVRTERQVSYESRPNWKEVSLSPGAGGVTRLTQAFGRGCIFPWELRSPEYPNGIAECCQFRGCFQQHQDNGDSLIETDYGAYCRPIEAKHAKIEQVGGGKLDSGKRLEVGFNSLSKEKQRSQLEAQSV